MKQCPQCSREVDAGAVFCPWCGYTATPAAAAPPPPADPKKGGAGVAWCVGIALALVAIGWVNTTFFHGDEPSADTRQLTAQGACEDSVKAQLKSPGSANFSEVVFIGQDDTIRVSGVVDSENSFGASLRTTWTCVATRSGTGDDTEYTGTAVLTSD